MYYVVLESETDEVMLVKYKLYDIDHELQALLWYQNLGASPHVTGFVCTAK